MAGRLRRKHRIAMSRQKSGVQHIQAEIDKYTALSQKNLDWYYRSKNKRHYREAMRYYALAQEMAAILRAALGGTENKEGTHERNLNDE